MQLITNTFVLVAPDCPATEGTVPKLRASGPTVAGLQYELLTARPYALTLEDLMFEVHARRQGLTPAEAEARAADIRALLFGQSYPCMRASPLPKSYGWGVHHDGQGRIALAGAGSAEYQQFAEGGAGVEVVVALRSKRA